MHPRIIPSLQGFLSELFTQKQITDNVMVRGHVLCRTQKFGHLQIIKQTPRYTIARSSPTSITRDETDQITQSPPQDVSFSLVYYPTSLDHSLILARSAVKRAGPAEIFPGSACTLNFAYNHPTKTCELLAVQYSFRQGSPKELTRTLAAKYLGARHHLLHSFFENAALQGIKSIVLLAHPHTKGLQTDLEHITSQSTPLQENFRKAGSNIYIRKT